MRRSFHPATGLPSTLVFALLLLACSKAGSPVPAATHALPVASKPTSTFDPTAEDQVLIAVSKALRQANLLSRPDQCYAYRFDPAPGQLVSSVDVRENHTHPECGGDPQTQPHLFTVHVDKTTHALSDDAKSPGTFQPLAP